jgi:hypothetical protein
MSTIDLTSLKPAYNTQTKSSIQVSYPSSIDNVETNSGMFYLSSARTLPNFTYTNSTDSKYISGSAVQGFVTGVGVKVSRNKTYTNSLVMKHATVSGTTFYVVIPLDTKKDSKTSLSTLLKNGKGILNLNSDIHNPDANTSIYHSKARVGTTTQTSLSDVFVFNKPIYVNKYGNVDLGFTIFSVVPNEVITSTSKIEEDMDCQSEEDIGTTEFAAANESYVYFVMFFVDIFIIVSAYMLITKTTIPYTHLIALFLFPAFIMFIVLLAYSDKGKLEAKSISDLVSKSEAQAEYNTHIAVSANLAIAFTTAACMAWFQDPLKTFATTLSSATVASVAAISGTITSSSSGTPVTKIKPRWI